MKRSSTIRSTQARTARNQFWLFPLLFSLALFASPVLHAQVSGTKTVPGDYATLAAAVTDLNTSGIGAGGVTINVAAGYTETAPAGGISLTATGTLANPIVIQKSGAGANPVITAFGGQTSGSLNDAVIKLIGADYVTINGLTLQENAANTTTAAGTNNMTEWGIALLYASATNGAQNNTIQNCSISLNRTYQNTFGIYSNVRHNATAPTATNDISAVSGSNSNLKIYSNSISNVNLGIVVVGSTTTANMDSGLDIGGASSTTGNTITNYGTTATFSGYSSVSGTINGIYINNNININVSYNSITSSTGAVTAGTFRGIFVDNSGSASSAAVTNNINNNSISLSNAGTGNNVQGITNSMGGANITVNINGNTIGSAFTVANSGTYSGISNTVGTGTAININGNNFQNFTLSVASSATFNFIVNSSGAFLNQTINGNTFTALNLNTTGGVTFINCNNTMPANGVRNVNGNNIVTSFNKAGAGGTVQFYNSNSSSTATATETNSGNNFSNITVTGGTTIAGWLTQDGSTTAPYGPAKTITGNTFNNIVGGTNAVTILTAGYSSSSVTTNTVSGNTISNVTGGGAITGLIITQGNQIVSSNTINNLTSTGGAVTGLSVTTGTTNNVSQNTINTLSTNGAAAVLGISVSGGTTGNFLRNKIYDLQANNAGGTVNGILISTATTANLYNNLIGDLRAPISTGTSDAVRGINITSTSTGSTINVGYNTIRLSATSSGVNFSTSGIFHTTSATATTATLNLRNNIIINNSTPAGTGTAAAYRRSSTALGNFASTSNNNLFYAGTPSAVNLIFSDGTNASQTLAAYKTLVGPRESVSGTENTAFLSTVGSSANFLHIDPATATQAESGGANISGVTDDFDGDIRQGNPGYSGAGIAPDLGADEGNFIVNDLLPPSITYTALTFTCTTTDRTLSATIADATGVPLTGGTVPRIYYNKNGGTWYSQAGINTGGTATNGTWNFTIVSADMGGVAIGDVVNYYVIAQDLVAIPNIGSSPSGVSATDVNTVATPPATPNSYSINPTLNGTYTVGVGGNYTTLTAAVNAYNTSCIGGPVVFSLTDAAYPSETFPITVNVNAQSNATNTLTIRPAGGVTATISGSSTVPMIRILNNYVTIDGSNSGGTDRSLSITNTSTTTPGVLLIASTGTVPVTNVTVKNTVLTNGINTSTAVIVSDAGTPGNAGYFNTITLQNNSIQKAFVGVYVIATVAAGNGANLVISGNNLNSTGTNAIRNIGIYVQGADGATVSNNTIGNFSATEGEIDRGVWFATGTVNSTVSNNTISTLGYTGTSAFGPTGISITSTVAASNINVTGNTVTGLSSSGTAQASSGISITGATGGVTLQKNKISNIKNSNSSGYGSNGILLNSTITGANILVANNFIFDVAAYGYASGAGLDDNGYGIIVNGGSGYSIFNNSVLLNTNQNVSGLPAALNVTSGVTTAGAVDVRNNIFASTQTVGTNRYAIYSGATNTVFLNIDYNDYFSSGPNPGNISATNRADIAAIQAGFGGNTHSVAVAPIFVSATDLHMSPLPNNPVLVDLATPLAAVTTDIDGDPRGSTPDVGADEFANRPATPTSLVQNASTPSCTGGTALHVLPTVPANVIYYLQTSATDTSTATPFVGDSVVVFTNGAYYAKARNSVSNLWSGSAASVTVSNIPVAPLPPSPVADQSPACLTTNVTVPSPGSPNVTYYWQGTTSGGTSNAQNASSPLAVTASGTYYVAAYDALTNCWSNTNGVAVVIDTQVPPAPVVNPAAPALCLGNGTVLAINANTQSPASGTGTATTTGNTTGAALGPNPFQTFYGGTKQQMLFTASELTAMGLLPGSTINNVGLQMATANGSYSLASVRVKMGLTASTALSTWETGLTVVRPAGAYTPVVGWNNLALTTPFVWNGTSNLVVEINYSNNNGGGSSPFNTAQYTTTPFVSTLFYRDDNLTPANVNTYTGTPSNTYSARNNVRFISIPGGYTYTWAPNTSLYTDSTMATSYSGGAANSVYTKPTTSLSYTATTHLASCPSAPTTVAVTVNPLPVVDAGPTQEVCPGANVTLSGSGATSYTWNNGVTNGTPFVATTTTLYTVTGTDANTCSATDTVTVVVKPGTAVTITASGPLTVCQNDTLTLTANGPAQYGPSAVFTQWNFNGTSATTVPGGNASPTPSTGTGTALLIGGTTAPTTFVSGTANGGSSDPVNTTPDNYAWNTTTYPASGTGFHTAGIQFNVSTAGQHNVKFKFDNSGTPTSANTVTLQYNPDITNGFAPWITVASFVTSAPNTFENSKSFDFSGIPAANDNANFAVRLVADSAGGTGNYVATSTTYGTGGGIRYDMVTFEGSPIAVSYVWSPGGQTTTSIQPTSTGTYTVTVTEPSVCSGTASAAVTVNPVFSTVLYPAICDNETYTLANGDAVNTAGIYSRTVNAVTGCDSVVVVNLTVHPTYNTPVAATICSNHTYTLADGTVVSTAGTYTKTVNTIHNCDSTVVVTLTVLPAQSVTVTQTICANQNYTLPNGTVVTTAGTYTNTFPAANGCDSTIITTLTVKPVFTSTQNPAICAGDSHTMPDGSTQTVAGTYAFPYTAVNGCDSTITVNLTVNPVYTTNIDVNLCPGDSYTLVDGTVVNANGSYTAVTNSISGCDSTVIAAVTVRPVYNTPVTASICQGTSYTLVNGAHVSTAGTYVAATQSIYGCDSVVTVTLTLKPSYNLSVSDGFCEGGSYLLPNGTSVSAAGTYVSHLTSSAGCDSTITTTLTVNPLPVLNLGSNIAVPNPPVILNAGTGFTAYDWSTGAHTQTISVSQNGTFSVTVTNSFGCEASDSIQVNFTTSIVSLGENGGSISLFPNPASERFTLNVYGYTGGGKMKLDLINAIGQVVKTEWIGNATESFSKEMDVAALPPGSYTLRVKGENAEANLRLIIAK